VHLVPPLDTPDPAHLPPPAELTSHEAIALFTDRARLAKTDFRIDETNAQAVAEICRQVDALPLAIELAASRIGMFPPDVLLGQLSHSLETLSRGGRVRPGRQQTLAGAIDWSYRLLGEQEQVLLARLSVLRGAWSARAAEAVSGNGVVLDVPGGLASLVAQSLLRSSSEDEGFSMLKTIRQFAAQKLTERGEEPETGERHARYFTDLAARAEPLIRGKDQAQWLRWLELSIDNFRAAMSWLLEHGRIEEELHLAADLYGFWFRRGHWSEGLRWLESGLERAEHVAAPVRIRALQAAGDLSNWLGRYDRAAAALREGLALAQETGDVIGSARALRTLSTIARWQDNLDTAESFARQSLAMYEQTDDLAGRALATNALGVVAYQQQDYARARELVSAALASWRTVGDTFSVVWALNNLGVLAMEQDDPAEARDRLLEALALGRDISAPSGTVLCLANLGDLSVRLGEYRQAAGFLQEGIRLAYELGYTSNLLNLLTYTVEWLAALDRARAVASLSGAIIARREALGQPVSRADRPRWEQVLESAEARLGDERFHADQDAGRALGLDEAAHFALRELETLLPET
jgi:tetratricopeptide (TPR) repeat protein